MEPVVQQVLSAIREVSPRRAAEISWYRHRGDAVHRTLSSLSSPGDVMADIGAHEGTYAAGMLRLVGAGGTVHAFEPNPAMVRFLRRFDAPQLTVHECALSDAPGSATLRIPIRDGARRPGLATLEQPAAKSDAITETVEVRLARLDEMLAGTPRLDLIKCDVEGHERAVLAGARSLLERFRPALIIEIEQRHQPRPISEVIEPLLDLGYAGYAYFADGIRPLEAFDLERDQLRHLEGRALAERMPVGYVSEFVFVPPEVDAAALRSVARRNSAARRSSAADTAQRPPLMPEGSLLASAVRRATNRVGATGLLMGSEGGQRIRQAVRASTHVAQPTRFLVNSALSPGESGLYSVPAHTHRGQRLEVILRHRTDDVLSFNEIFHHGIYRLPDPVRERLGAPDAPLSIVDLGANIGLFSVWITAELPGAELVALEPDPANFACLERQLEANHLGARVSASRAAAGARSGTVHFAAGRYIHSAVTPDAGPGSIAVEQRDALAILDGADLAKIDIEGSEWAILKDARFRDLRLGALVMEWHATTEHPAGQAEDDVLELLGRAGFSVVEQSADGPACGVLWAIRN